MSFLCFRSGPSLEFEDFKVTHDAVARRFTVSGIVKSNYRAHSVVVANESKATRSDYWRKCLAGQVAEDGSFKVEIDELDETDGQLRIVCCFNNGAVICKEPGYGLSSGFIKQYKSTNGGFEFTTGWAKDAGATRRRRPGAGQPRQGSRDNK